LIAGETGYEVNGICVNRDVNALQERIYFMNAMGVFNNLTEINLPVIVEIGGGYGGLAYHLTSFFPNAIYIIIDLHASLVYSICYLTLTTENKKLSITKDIQDEYESSTIAFLGPEVIHSILKQKIDLAINTLSFAEMSKDVVSNYALFIANNLKPHGHLYQQDFRYPNADQNHYCDPHDVLTKYFKTRKTYTGNFSPIYGEPSLWSNDSE